MSIAYFPFYADRYEADTAHLSMIEDGAYNRLLRLCWRSPGCKLPDDQAWIYRQMRAATAADRAAIDAVLAEFFRRSKGKIWNPKLLEIYGQVSEAHQQRSEAGKRGAAAKAMKSKEMAPSNAKARLKQPEPEPEPDTDLFGSNEPQNAKCDRKAENRFDEFWASYPRKVAKDRALKAWKPACNKADPDKIIAAAKRYAVLRAGEDDQYTAYAASWLNAGRFNDPDLQPAMAATKVTWVPGGYVR